GFRTWLWTILLNQCRRYAGRQARDVRAVSIDSDRTGEPSAAVATGEGNAALAGLLAHERREILEQLLLHLSSLQATALRLRFFGGLKFQEIADAMQCSLCTAKNRVRWGLLRLSELVQDETSRGAVADAPKQDGDNDGSREANVDQHADPLDH